jgi:hypothetical protein
VSKKAFKQAIGVLFKSGQILIEKTGIRWVAPQPAKKAGPAAPGRR